VNRPSVLVAGFVPGAKVKTYPELALYGLLANESALRILGKSALVIPGPCPGPKVCVLAQERARAPAS
jgi:hypothetical protein